MGIQWVMCGLHIIRYSQGFQVYQTVESVWMNILKCPRESCNISAIHVELYWGKVLSKETGIGVEKIWTLEPTDAPGMSSLQKPLTEGM
jgi:hypothetical protein